MNSQHVNSTEMRREVIDEKFLPGEDAILNDEFARGEVVRVVRQTPKRLYTTVERYGQRNGYNRSGVNLKTNLIKNIEIMNEQKLSKETETKPDGYTVLGAVSWEPEFYADIDENAEDGDYLREQLCCTSCGAHTGYLPGYYWIEDNDSCPKCRVDAKEEKWSDEVKRIMERNELPEDEINETVNALLECGL